VQTGGGRAMTGPGSRARLSTTAVARLVHVSTERKERRRGRHEDRAGSGRTSLAGLPGRAWVKGGCMAPFPPMLLAYGWPLFGYWPYAGLGCCCSRECGSAYWACCGGWAGDAGVGVGAKPNEAWLNVW
jgi:hypothetical protein